jgi:hypothetical protein
MSTPHISRESISDDALKLFCILVRDKCGQLFGAGVALFPKIGSGPLAACGAELTIYGFLRFAFVAIFAITHAFS